MSRDRHLLELNWHPSDRQLQQFGWIALVALPLLGWFFTSETSVRRWLWGMLTGTPQPLTWDAGNLTAIGILAAIGLALAIAGQVRPQLIKPVFLGACLVAFPIGLVVSEALLALMYFGVFLPVALWFRIIGRDALQRQLEPNASTYWQPKKQAKDAASYFRQS